jgi:hypothetical protein
MPVGTEPRAQRSEVRQQLFSVLAEIVRRLGIFAHSFERATDLRLVGLGLAGLFDCILDRAVELSR